MDTGGEVITNDLRVSEQFEDAFLDEEEDLQEAPVTNKMRKQSFASSTISKRKGGAQNDESEESKAIDEGYDGEIDNA